MKMGLVPKCLEEHSTVRGQGLGVKGQGSGGQNRGQISRFGDILRFLLGLPAFDPCFDP